MRLLKESVIVVLALFFRLLGRLSQLARFGRLARIWRHARWKARLKHLGPDVTFYGGVIIHDPGYVSIGRGACLAEYVHMWGAGGIEIGENTLIGPHTAITSQTHDTKASIYRHSSVLKQVHIEDNVWIGAHVVVLPGVRIGRNAIIGAGAVVTRDVRERDIVVGVPAGSLETRREKGRRITTTP